MLPPLRQKNESHRSREMISSNKTRTSKRANACGEIYFVYRVSVVRTFGSSTAILTIDISVTMEIIAKSPKIMLPCCVNHREDDTPKLAFTACLDTFAHQSIFGMFGE